MAAKAAKDPATKVRNKAARLEAIADKLDAGKTTAQVASELGDVGNLVIGLSDAWSEDPTSE